MTNTGLPEFLESGSKARLMPVMADTSKEGRITSSLLASLTVIPDFTHSIFSYFGVKVAKSSKLECFAEVVLKNVDKKKTRPDGLVIIHTGKKQWSALIEAKIGNNEIEQEQVERYLDLAKEHKIDAVITISNQFTASPEQHIVQVNKTKTRSVKLYHWSWTYLMSEAVMWTTHHGISDPEQAFILGELVRYMEHDSAGISAMTKMNPEWKEICSSIQNDVPLKKTSKEVHETVVAWHQLTRYLTLKLGVRLGAAVTISLKKTHRDSLSDWQADDCEKLSNAKILEVDFDVPDAASKINLKANFRTKVISASMRLNAPKEKATAKGRIGWLLQQLKKADSKEAILIKASWQGRAPETFSTLEKLQSEGIAALIHSDSKNIPVSFEVVLTKELGGKFNGSITFIQQIEPLVYEFYSQVGQHLKEWVASPPKMKNDTLEVEVQKIEAQEIEVQKIDSTNDSTSIGN